MARKRKKKRRLPRWTHPGVYAAVRAGDAAFHLAGVDHSIKAMRTLGGAFASLPANKKRLERAKANLAWCFPEWDEQRVHLHAIEAYRHLFCLVPEMCIAPKLITHDRYAEFVKLGDLKTGIDVLLRGRPCLLVTGHAGNWELLGLTLSMLGFSMHALYRPLDMKPLDRWVHRTRSRRGLVLVDKFGAARKLPPIVERGDPVAFIADQNAGDRGLFVPFFNRLASAYKTIGVMAMRYNAAIVCGHAVRLTSSASHQRDQAVDPTSPPAPDKQRYDAQEFRYRVDVIDVIEPEDWADHPDQLFYITARYRRAIEEMVRRAPEQYLWMHRYWKSQPRHERHNKPFPPRLREKLRTLPWMSEHDVERLIERSERDRAERHPASPPPINPTPPTPHAPPNPEQPGTPEHSAPSS